MANGSTTNLALIKPEVGADSDAWGGHLNTDMDTLDALLVGVITGLTLSAAGSTGTFGVALGAANGMTLASAYTKTTSAWAVGTAAGALDTGAIANNTWYHVFLIQRVDTGVVDIVFSATATPASGPTTLPTNYTRFRRIGSMKTDGSAQWVKFSQKGNDFIWDVQVLDINALTPGVTTAQSKTLTVPTGVQVYAKFNYLMASGAAAAAYYFSALDKSDEAATSTLCSGYCYIGGFAGAGVEIVRTNTNGQIRVRVSQTDASYYLSTRGWVDPLGQW